MKTILLIEDDVTLSSNTAEILELAKYHVITAPNGKEGVRMAKEFRPDVIICDIMMPELDGYGVLHILSKDTDTMGIPFIFLTSKADRSDFRKGMALGADDYLTKPFEETEILNAIEGRLKRNEILAQKYSTDIEGLNLFLKEAGGIAELEKLSSERPLVHYDKKDTIYREGDTANFLYFLNKGAVKTFKSNDEGKEYVTGMYNSGQFFGYVNLLEKGVLCDSAIAMELSEICKIPKDLFLDLLYKNRDVASRFIKMLAGSVAESEQRLINLAYDSVRKRVADALLSLHLTQGKTKNRDGKISIVRDDLASIVGTATESVIRCLKDFKEEKLIDVLGRDIVILNEKGLGMIQ